MISSTKSSTDREADITELETVAMITSFIDTNRANKVYEKINSQTAELGIVMAGTSVASLPIVSTESSYEFQEKYTRYVVHTGDTLSIIASKFGVTTDSIKWSNKIGNEDMIKPGRTLYIPAMTGIIYVVKRGDTVDLIAAKFKSKRSAIIVQNDLYGESIKVGMTLIIPNGKIDDPKPAPSTGSVRVASSSGSGRYGSSSYIGRTGSFKFPTIAGRNGYYNGYHWWAIDIPNSIGTPIYASDSGRIAESAYGWNGGFGNTILIDHGGGWQTRYGHMSILRIRGGYVSRGQIIGYMGSTGRSTGSHLHFEIIKNGSQQNPMNYF